MMLQLLLSLPLEIQLIILAALSPKDIMNLACSCKTLNEVAHHEKLWETKFKECFPQEITSKTKTVSWYHLFKRIHLHDTISYFFYFRFEWRLDGISTNMLFQRLHFVTR